MTTPTRQLRPHPDLDQLKRQAKELLDAFRSGEAKALSEVQAHYRGAKADTFALHDAQLVIARAYGFDSWPQLKAFVEGLTGRSSLIKPVELESADGRDTWDTIVAASTGDIAILRRLLERHPRLARAEYWYAPAVHFAAREGHVEAVRLLLDAGADPERNGLNDRTLIEMARERGHGQVVQMLEHARDQPGRVVAHPADHPIHLAAGRGDVNAVSALLNANPNLVGLGDRFGGTPLHRAVLGGRRGVVTVLLDRGADMHALHGSAAWPGNGLINHQAIDLAIWGGRRQSENLDIARLLVSRGAAYDLTIASAFGDLAAVQQMLDDNPSRITETRPSGRRPLSAAVEFGHDDIARLLLERGANPRWEPAEAVHAASSRGNFAMLKLLLEHGADPNEEIDSTSSPLAFAATPDIRALLESYGAGLGDYDTTWIEHDDARLKSIAAQPHASYRIGAAFTMSADRPDLLARLLGAGLRMPAIHTSCQGYLNKPNALRTLLAHGMSPDQMNWQHQTLLHHASTQDTTECAAILLDAGATITARDDEYRSTPLAWAARANKPQMVEFLLSRGAPVNLPDDEPWATPLAWADRRGHQQIASILRAHGATR
jgi:ankyrin repeat protein